MAQLLLSSPNYALATMKYAQTFRKGLPIDYKRGPTHYHRNTHAIPMVVKDRLMKKHGKGQFQQIKELERRSNKPFGKWYLKKFVTDPSRIPNFIIPDLKNFDLKPYVEFNTPLLSQQLKAHQQNVNSQKLVQVGLQLKQGKGNWVKQPKTEQASQ